MTMFLRAIAVAVALMLGCVGVQAACTPTTTPNTSGVTANSQLEILEEMCGNQNTAGTGIAALGSADSVSNFVAKSSGGKLHGFTIKIGATTGYVMLFDATALPANGPVTACAAGHSSGCVALCYPVLSNGTLGGASFDWRIPMLFSNGITGGFSSTGCDTLTASATAKFSGVLAQ